MTENPGAGVEEDGSSEDEALLRAALAVADGSSPDDVDLPGSAAVALRGPLAALAQIERVRAAMSQQPGQDPQLNAGAIFGPYEIGSLIARGGMGEVYRARHLRLGREVALKIVGRKSRLDPNSLTRFEREAKLAASVSHPNLVTLFEIVEADGRLCLVFELLKGETLQARIARGTLSEGEAAKVGEKVARGITALHAASMTHRDIKPGNIFLCEDGEVKVLDLGIARPLERGEDDTRTGVDLLGTPSYMPPERIYNGVYSPAGDVFCLGVVVYEAVTGQHPFRKDSLDATLAAIGDAEPSMTQVPRLLVPVLVASLRKDPQARPTALSVAKAFAEVQAGRLPNLGGASRGLTSGRKALLGLGVLLAVGLYWRRSPEPSPTPPSVPVKTQPSPPEDVYRNFLEAQALVDDSAPASLKKARELYEGVIKRAPAFAPAFARYSNLLQSMSAFVDGMEPQSLDSAATAAAKRALELDPNLAAGHQALTDVLSQQNDWAGAEASILRSLELDPNAADAHHSYSISVLVPMGRLAEAERHSLRAVELQPFSDTFAEALGRVYYFERRYDLALTQWNEVLARNPRELASLWRKGQAEIFLGRPADALKTFAIADSFTPGIRKGQTLVALAKVRMGDIQGARAILEKFRQDRRHGTYISPTLLGAVEVFLGENDAAFEDLMRACSTRADWVRFAKVDPLLDPIRKDPRFDDLLRCLHLSP